MPPNQHALLSASSAHRWTHCTPSARLEQEFADKETEAAAEGTAAHALCEHKLRRVLKMRSKKPVSQYDSDEMDGYTDDYVQFVKEAIAEAKQYCKDPIFDWTLYVSTLCKKPRALENTRFFHQFPDLWKDYLIKTNGKERKSALQLLEEIVSDGNVELCDDTLLLAKENGRTDADSLRQCYYMISKRELRPTPLALESPPVMNYNPNLSVYDGLMGGEAHG